jgi:Putative lumazine-binding
MASIIRTTICPGLGSRRRCLWGIGGGIRNHMSHHHPHGGSGGLMMIQQSGIAGPQSRVALGLEASEAAHHLLRLVESSFMMMGYQEEGEHRESIWHSNAVKWVLRNGIWCNGFDMEETGNVSAKNMVVPQEPPRLISLQFSDPRTALVHVTGNGGEHMLLSILRLDSPMGQNAGHSYNGWRIVRSIVSTSSSGPSLQQREATPTTTRPNVYAEIEALLQLYFQVEHGGGHADRATAANTLFSSHRSTSLLTIGISEMDQPISAWAAPWGSLLEIPLNVYLESVHTQTPHGPKSWSQDEVLSIRVLPCHSAAAVELHVGSAACDRIFHDHLLLGRSNDDGSWKILSKIFSVQKWEL